MCTVAGYTGTERAAPILIDMMRKLEGLDSGFYTGLATFHQGKIYYAKAAGDLEHLLATTDAASLPGTMGIIHSRTPSAKLPAGGGPDCWAHPFICQRDGEIQNALVMNGCGGVFKGTFPVADKTIRLMEAGYAFQTHLPDAGNTQLPDGTYVHSTEVRCQLAGSKLAAGMDAADALEETFTEMPGESVSLMLSLTEPEAIAFARLIMPMHVAFAPHGAYLATAPLAMPADAGAYTMLPVMSSGKVRKDGFTARPFKKPPVTVAPITPEVVHAAYAYLSEALKEPTPFIRTGVEAHLKELYPAADCTQRLTVTYQVVSEFQRQGRLRVETRYVPGQRADLRAPLFYLSLKD